MHKQCVSGLLLPQF